MTTTTYQVDGMTCEHCVGAVTTELRTLDGVSEVSVELSAAGPATVTVTSAEALAVDEVADALDEAGAYTLVGR